MLLHRNTILYAYIIYIYIRGTIYIKHNTDIEYNQVLFTIYTNKYINIFAAHKSIQKSVLPADTVTDALQRFVNTLDAITTVDADLMELRL